MSGVVYASCVRCGFSVEENLAQLHGLRFQLAEARDWVRRLTSAERTLTCVYCGHAYPPGTPEHGADVLTEHVKRCEKHPMREAEAQLAEAQRENEAWRALAEWECAPGVYRALVVEERYEPSHPYTFCAEDGSATRHGSGETPQAAAIDLATKLGLIHAKTKEVDRG